jgi:AcrR family transcriptional regulator/DNA-binding MarR family transcriptional regulator
VSSVQRRRILAAAVDVVEDHGIEGASGSRIVTQARVSRKTFYDLFETRTDCVLAAMEQAIDLAAERSRAAWNAQDTWVARVRAGLLALLQFCDERPELARLCVLQSGAAGTMALYQRGAAFERLAELVDKGREVASRPESQLTAYGLVSGTFGVIQARLLDAEPRSLVDLLNPLMSFIVLPYLGADAARQEAHRPPPAVSPERSGKSTADALEGVRLTYRTLRVLAAIAAKPGLTNTEVSEGAGVSDQGQISKLLSRLADLDFVENRGEGGRRGPNAWHLTPLGEQIEQTIGHELLTAPNASATLSGGFTSTVETGAGSRRPMVPLPHARSEHERSRNS